MIESEIFKAKVVTGIQSKPKVATMTRSLKERLNGTSRVSRIEGCVGTGVEFNAVSTNFACAIGKAFLGRNEDAGANAAFLEASHHIRKERSVSQRVPAVVGGELVGSVWHQGDLCGVHGADKVDELRRGIALDVKLRGELGRGRLCTSSRRM